MRGKVFLASLVLSVYRITPAYAGKRQKGGTALCPRRDHPRLCGEKPCSFHNACQIIGSPPPMRGKVQYTPNQNICQGITPAYAGKSLSSVFC